MCKTNRSALPAEITGWNVDITREPMEKIGAKSGIIRESAVETVAKLLEVTREARRAGRVNQSTTRVGKHWNKFINRWRWGWYGVVLGRAVTIRRRRFRDLERIGGKWGNKGITGIGVWILSRSFTGKHHCEGQLKLKVFVRCGGDGGGGAEQDWWVEMEAKKRGAKILG